MAQLPKQVWRGRSKGPLYNAVLFCVDWLEFLVLWKKIKHFSVAFLLAFHPESWKKGQVVPRLENPHLGTQYEIHISPDIWNRHPNNPPAKGLKAQT